MGTEKFIAFKEDGSAYRLKGRILRFLDNEPVSEADKTNIRSTLSVPASGEGLTPANNLSDLSNVATARTNLSVNSIDEDAQANGTKVTAPALYFNGSSSNVIISADSKLVPTDGTNDTAFSGSCLVKADDLTTCPLFGIYGTSAASRNYRFNVNGSDKLTLLLIDTGGHSAFVVSDTAVTAYEGKWVHFAFTYGGSDSGSFGSAANRIALYINGSAVAVTPTNDNGGNYDGMSDGSNPLWIGRFDNSYKKSSIRDVKIFNRELTASEVAELARGNDLGFADEWGGANGGVYTSDFTSDSTNSFSATRTTLDAASTVGSDTDNLKIVSDATASATHSANRASSAPSSGKRATIRGEYYIPSGQTAVDGFELYIGGGSTALPVTTGTTDAWTAFEFEATDSRTDTSLYIYLTDGGSSTFNGVSGEYVAFRNIKVTQIGTLADFRAERYDTSTSKLYDISDNAFVGTGTSVSLTGREQPVYETGTWSPSLVGSGGSDFTYSEQEGYYTRNGDTVFIRGTIIVTGLGTSSGNISIAGFPFTASSGGNNSSVLSTYINNAAALTSQPIILMGDGTATGFLFDIGTTGQTSISISNLTATTVLRFSGTYQIQ